MITVGVIRNGATYLSQHLRKNDYWQEGEKEVCGEWIGQAAHALELEGAVTDKPFEAFRSNRDWRSGKRLTARENKARMALFDMESDKFSKLRASKDIMKSRKSTKRVRFRGSRVDRRWPLWRARFLHGVHGSKRLIRARLRASLAFKRRPIW